MIPSLSHYSLYYFLPLNFIHLHTIPSQYILLKNYYSLFITQYLLYFHYLQPQLINSSLPSHTTLMHYLETAKFNIKRFILGEDYLVHLEDFGYIYMKKKHKTEHQALIKEMDKKFKKNAIFGGISALSINFFLMKTFQFFRQWKPILILYDITLVGIVFLVDGIITIKQISVNLETIKVDLIRCEDQEYLQHMKHIEQITKVPLSRQLHKIFNREEAQLLNNKISLIV